MISPIWASKLLYYRVFRKKCNLASPSTWNEKLMWLKLFEDDHLKTQCSDKVQVRNYIASLGYEHILVNCLAVYEEASAIDFDQLPTEFMLKCSHGSGFNIVCTNKELLNVQEVVQKLTKWQQTNYAYKNCEPHYHSIPARIVAEQILQRDANKPFEYLFHCFHGKVQLIEVVLEREDGENDFVTYTASWEPALFNETTVNLSKPIPRPEKLAEMLEIATALSHSFTYVRVDLYDAVDAVYFGELTFTPDACLDDDFFEEARLQLGSYLHLQPHKRPRLSNKSALSKTT